MQILVLFKGHPGAGKSSIARCLAREMKWPIIDKDDSKDILMTQPGCPLERDANAFSYSIMLRTAQTQLHCGFSVILDCPLAHLDLYQRAKAIAAEEDAVIVVVDCICKDHEVWKHRLAARVQADVGTDKIHKPQEWEEIEAIFRRYDGCDKWVDDSSLNLNLVKVDTSRSTPQEICQAVINYMKRRGLLTATPMIPPDDPVFLNSG